MLNHLFGTRIITSALALQETEERLFPLSRHRSARIRKKLIKRHGGEFRKVPCMYRLESENALIVHPSMMRRLEQEIERANAYANRKA